MSDERKQCPFCGEDIEKDTEKCPHCGELLLKTCPYCGEKIKINALKCKHCGEMLNNINVNATTNNIDNNTDKLNIAIGIVSLLICFIVIFIFVVAFNNNNESTTEQNNQMDNNSTNDYSFIADSPKCESKRVKDTVIQLFKENNRHYKAINPDTISSIELLNPVAVAYDESIDKYFCKGTIVMKSNVGFMPNKIVVRMTEEECKGWNAGHCIFPNAYIQNAYVVKVVDDWAKERDETTSFYRLNTYNYNLEYTALKNDDGIYVEANVDGNNYKFSCDTNNCEVVDITKESLYGSN